MRLLKPVYDLTILDSQMDTQKRTEKRNSTGRYESTSQKLVRPPAKNGQEYKRKIGCPKAAQGTTRPKTT